MTAEPGLPAVLLEHRMVLAERSDWAGGRIGVQGGAVLVARSRPGGDVLLTVGDPAGVVDLLDGEARLHYRAGAPGAMWLSAPRSVETPPWILDALRLAPATTWDWMSIDEPTGLEPEVPVVRLGSTRDEVAEAREVLTAGNPISTADPLGPAEVAWFRSGEPGAVAGVIGARLAEGDPSRDGSFSWHLHGLAVRPSARCAGHGTALTIAAVNAGLAAGADWVSLGLYADNDAARRIYHRIRFRLEEEMASYAPVALTR